VRKSWLTTAVWFKELAPAHEIPEVHHDDDFAGTCKATAVPRKGGGKTPAWAAWCFEEDSQSIGFGSGFARLWEHLPVPKAEIRKSELGVSGWFQEFVLSTSPARLLLSNNSLVLNHATRVSSAYVRELSMARLFELRSHEGNGELLAKVDLDKVCLVRVEKGTGDYYD